MSSPTAYDWKLYLDYLGRRTDDIATAVIARERGRREPVEASWNYTPVDVPQEPKKPSGLERICNGVALLVIGTACIGTMAVVLFGLISVINWILE